MGPIGSKVKFMVFFSVGHVFCLICLHRRNHLTATLRRVKFTSISNIIYALNALLVGLSPHTEDEPIAVLQNEHFLSNG